VLGVGVVLLSDVVDPILVMLFGVGLLPDGGGASVIAVVVFELLLLGVGLLPDGGGASVIAVVVLFKGSVLVG
jgi:hypothetical protein